MTIQWEIQGPKVNSEELVAFEERNRVILPKSYKEYLMGVANGGAPSDEILFPITGLGEETHSVLHGLYGVWSSEPDLDLENAVQALSELFDTSLALPIAYDPLNGQLVLKVGIQPMGEVCYKPWDMIYDPLETSLFHVADSFEGFIDSLYVEE